MLFICYASCHYDWCQVLHRNLSRCLGVSTVFLDREGLSSNRSWVQGLQAALRHTARLLLVASPEAFASPWVRNELDTFVAEHRNWKADGLIQVALLVDTPLPPCLVSLQHVDFRQHDDNRYKYGLKRILAGIQGLRSPESLPPLPADLVVPSPPVPDLPAELRNQLVRLLIPIFHAPTARIAIAARLGVLSSSLEDHSTADLAASAALVAQGENESACTSAQRLIAVVHDLQLVHEGPHTDELRALQAQLSQRAASTSIEDRRAHIFYLPKPNRFVHPTGTVPLDSDLYVEREVDEAAAQQLTQPHGLVHLVGSRQMGKSSLLVRLVQWIGVNYPDWLVALVSLQNLDAVVLADIRLLLAQLAMEILDTAGRDPKDAVSLTTSPLSAKLALKKLFQREILQHYNGVLLAIDETDRVVRPRGCDQDFFTMLRAWHESGKSDSLWSRLRIVLSFCTEAHMIPVGQHSSPLGNVGLKCYLRDFNAREVEWLAGRHGLASEPPLIETLMDYLGGHPYLIRRALYALVVEGYEMSLMLREAKDGEGPLGDHMKYHLHRIQARPELAEALRRVLEHSTCSDPTHLYGLEGSGLVRRAGKQVLPRYPIYHDFLRSCL